MTTPLKVGIAGYGIVGKRRRQVIDERDDMSVVAVCDQTLDGEGAFDDGTLYFTDYRKLLNENLDALLVCMSNDIAAEVTVAGLEKNLHVFCEKPPGRDVADIESVVACSSSRPHLKLKYGFNHRYHHSVREALKIVRSGELGRVINLRGVYGKSQLITFGQDSWRTRRELAGGGVLLDQGIHMVDLIRLFAGEFTNVHSFVSNDHWGHEVEDNAYALMRTAEGTVAMLHSSATQWRHSFRLEINLARGALILSGILSGSKSYGAETLTVMRIGEDDRGDPREDTTRYNQDPSWSDEIAEFAEAVIKDKKITNGSADEALKTMQLVYRIYCADPDWKSQWNLTDHPSSSDADTYS
jgi:predicted dehydrogenase